MTGFVVVESVECGGCCRIVEERGKRRRRKKKKEREPGKPKEKGRRQALLALSEVKAPAV